MGPVLGGAVVGDSACRTRAATGDLLYSRNLLEDPRTTKEPLDVPWKISRDPHALAQGVTLGHALSVKNRHGRGWRLLDRKKPATTMESACILEKPTEMSIFDSKEINQNREKPG
jgi:hypothetical protein